MSLQNIGSQIQSGVQNIGSQIQSGTQDVGNQIQSGAQDVINQIQKLFNQIKEFTNNFSNTIQKTYNDNIVKMSQTGQQLTDDSFREILKSYRPTILGIRDIFKSTINSVITMYNQVVLAIAFIPDKDQHGFKVTLDKSYQTYKDTLKKTYDSYISFVNSSQAGQQQSNINYDGITQYFTDTYNSVLSDSDTFYQEAISTIKINKNNTIQKVATDFGNAIHIDKNNFSLEQIQQLGRTKQTWESTIIPSGQFDNVMSFNSQSPNLFYSMIDVANIPSDYNTNPAWVLPLGKWNVYDVSCNSDLSNNTLTDVQINSVDPVFYNIIQGILPTHNMSIREFCSNRNQIKNQIVNQYDLSCNATLLDNTLSNDQINNSDPLFYKTVTDINNHFATPPTGIYDFCYKRELAKNKMNADAIQGHGQSHEKATSGYLERKTDYNVQIINIFNFSLGIALIMGAMYSFRS